MQSTDDVVDATHIVGFESTLGHVCKGRFQGGGRFAHETVSVRDLLQLKPAELFHFHAYLERQPPSNGFIEQCRYSTLPSPGYSMWIPWNGGWIPWNGGWIPYFWWMDSMEWGMDSIPFPGGFHTFSRWIPYLFQVDSIPFPGGFHTFFRWIPYYFHMESRWNKFLAS